MSSLPEPHQPPTHAFTQGTGTVFQFVGVTLFLISMFTCCCTSLLSKDTATHSGLTNIGWHRSTDAPDQPVYSVQRALTITLPASLVYGMALAALGLGLQAGNRAASFGAVGLNLAMTILWLVQLIFFASMRWIGMSLICFALLVVSVCLLLLSIGAIREMNSAADQRGNERSE
jgi:uncharacterized membrane protein